MYVDTCNVGTGCMIIKYDDGYEQSILYHSKKFDKYQRSISTKGENIYFSLLLIMLFYNKFDGLSSSMSETEQLQFENSNRKHYHSLLHQSSGWSNTGFISSVRFDWRAYSRLLQYKCRSPHLSFRDESQIIVSFQLREWFLNGTRIKLPIISSNSVLSICKYQC
ncbi:hypothetical protein ACTFIY_004604 [Dictyostelium cf. discoideum]